MLHHTEISYNMSCELWTCCNRWWNGTVWCYEAPFVKGKSFHFLMTISMQFDKLTAVWQIVMQFNKLTAI